MKEDVFGRFPQQTIQIGLFKKVQPRLNQVDRGFVGMTSHHLKRGV